MNTILNTELTYHAQVNRAQRIQEIINNIGLGQIVKEVYCCDFNTHKGHYLCITDTGITIIKDETKTKIITLYVTSFKELIFAYKSVKSIPKYLHKKVDRNQIKYIKKGKTIWR